MTGPPDPASASDAVPFAGCFGRKDATLVFVGLPDDSRSSYRRGSAAAPARIRLAYDGRSFNSAPETGVDLDSAVCDLGDWDPARDFETTAARWRDAAVALYREGRVPFFAGGDHAVTVPVVRALAALDRPVHVIQVDAHGDLYPEYDGDPSSHACTGARILEMDHVASLTQYGVRTLNAPQRELAARHSGRLRIHEARDLLGPLPPPERIAPSDPVYVTVDLDAFDPAHAPGVSHPVPGGLIPRQALDLLHALPGRLAGMDAVEVNPRFDSHDRTAILAARILHEGMGRATVGRSR